MRSTRVLAHHAPGQQKISMAEELRDIAASVRRIGDGYRTDPERIAVAKDEAANRLTSLARTLEVRHG